MPDTHDDALISEFIADSLEHLERVEPALLSLEESGSAVDPDLVHQVFRAVHTIKGSSGFFGFHNIQDLSHAMENLLTKVREGEADLDVTGIDALLAGVDRLRLLLESPSKSNGMNIRKEIHCLKHSSGNMKSARDNLSENKNMPMEKSTDFSSIGQQKKTALRIMGKAPLDVLELESTLTDVLSSDDDFVYAAWVFPEKDLKGTDRTVEAFHGLLESFGKLLASDLETTFPLNKIGHVILRTVLEPDFMEDALELPENQIMHLEATDIQAAVVQASVAENTESAPAETEAHADADLDQKESPLKQSERSRETIRVNVSLLDTLMNLAGELVLGRNALKQRLELGGYEDPKLEAVMQDVEMISSVVKEHIMQMRMQPIGNVLGRFKRLVRDFSRQVSKKVTLTARGGEVELDKSILEALSDPLTHLIRNCIDHGIEPPEERMALGKPEKGVIDLQAFHEAGQVNLVIRDDGRGIDLDKVTSKAVAKGILTEADAAILSRKDQLNLICLPGFSTVESVTDLSGRGVGMDVVRNNIEKIGGHLEIDTVAGEGTTIRIRLPLTLTIISCLMVRAADQRFAIPQINLAELVGIQASEVYNRIEKVGGADVLRLRDRLLPLIRLADVLQLEREFRHPFSGDQSTERRVRIADRRRENENGNGKGECETSEDFKHRRSPAFDRRTRRQGDVYVVVLRLGMHYYGLLVDELFDMEEVVVEPLLHHIKDCRCFAGATIMGDGRVAMILDPAGIADFSQLRFKEVSSEEDRRLEAKKREALLSEVPKRSIILFNNHPDEYFAIPLDRVSRLETIDVDHIRKIGDREYMTLKGEGLPLVRLDRMLPINAIPDPAKEIFVIIPKSDNGMAGIVASRIVDFFETDVAIKEEPEMPKEVVGSGIVGDQLTFFLDLDEVLASFSVLLGQPVGDGR